MTSTTFVVSVLEPKTEHSFYSLLLVVFSQQTLTNITSYEIKEAIREHGIVNFANVKLAILEIDCSIISGEKNLPFCE